jgi:hypothetical protein
LALCQTRRRRNIGGHGNPPRTTPMS